MLGNFQPTLPVCLASNCNKVQFHDTLKQFGFLTQNAQWALPSYPGKMRCCSYSPFTAHLRSCFGPPVFHGEGFSRTLALHMALPTKMSAQQRTQQLCTHIILHSLQLLLLLALKSQHIIMAIKIFCRTAWIEPTTKQSQSSASLQSGWAMAGCSVFECTEGHDFLSLYIKQNLFPIECPSVKPLWFSNGQDSWITFFWQDRWDYFSHETKESNEL